MTDFFATPAVQVGIAVLILCILIAAAFYLVSSFRDYTAQDQESTPEALFKLEEMHRKGDISDEEFRTIQTRTHQQPEGSELKDERSETDESSPESQS
jgi:uncharacterized membrane protein